MKNTYVQRVDNAMQTWHNALRSDSSTNDSVAARRQELIDSVLAEDNGMMY